MPNIVAFTGYSCTGKSLICSVLASELDVPVLSERRIIKDLSNERGYTRIREWLFSEGTNAILSSAREWTLYSIRRIKSDLIFLDGLYDWQLPMYLTAHLATLGIRIIKVEAADDLRLARMQKRHLNISYDDAVFDLRMIDLFKSISGVDVVMKEADCEVRNDAAVETAIRVVRDYLYHQGLF